MSENKEKFRLKSEHVLLIMACLIVLFLGYTQNMMPQSFVQGDSTVHVFTGDTVKVSYDWVNEYGYFTGNKTVPAKVSFSTDYPDAFNPKGTSWPSDNEQLSSGSLGNNQTLNGQVIAKIPDVPGNYRLNFNGHLKVNGSSSAMWTGAGAFTVKIVVSERTTQQTDNSTNGTNQPNQTNQTNNGNVTVEPNGDGTNTVTIPIELKNTLIFVIILGGLILVCGVLFIVLRRKENQK